MKKIISKVLNRICHLKCHEHFDVDLYHGFLSAKRPSLHQCWQYFLNIGEVEGVLVSQDFDPVVFRVRHPWLSRLPVSSVVFWRLFFKNKLYRTESLARDVNFHDPSSQLKYHEGEFEEIREAIRKVDGTSLTVGYNDQAKIQNQLGFLRSLVKADQPFSYVKLNHAVADTVIAMRKTARGIEREFRRGNVSFPQKMAFVQRAFQIFRPKIKSSLNFHREHTFVEWAASFGKLGRPNFHIALSPVGGPHNEISRYSRVQTDDLLEIMGGAKGVIFCDGLESKKYAYTGELYDFYQEIQKRYDLVVVVGPESLSYLFERKIFSGLHIAIPYKGAVTERRKIEQSISKAIKRSKSPVVLYQAGLLAQMMICRLYDKHPKLTQIDLGLALNTFNPITASIYPWYQFHRVELMLANRLPDDVDFAMTLDDPKIVRDYALSFEQEGDISSALKLMKKAKKLNPNGRIITRKLEEYRSRGSIDDSV